jgi:hypothetical protein
VSEKENIHMKCERRIGIIGIVMLCAVFFSAVSVYGDMVDFPRETEEEPPALNLDNEFYDAHRSEFVGMEGAYTVSPSDGGDAAPL